ncbi:hypothetical protein CSO01_29020 [Cellulomonas soli]|uniref:DUF4229 domain-containing protein n=1 Tax=Cellulomonas soli TaxID=931535 RepID=A0A512PG51_9CELL|nr:hypothetical protein CSO01_29020 [Cellulomonas soli]
MIRLALFLACVAGLWWAGMQSWLNPIVAAFLAWGFSYVLLAGPRDDAARYLAARDAARRDARAARGGGTLLPAHAQEDADVEDAAVDAAEASAAPGARSDEPVAHPEGGTPAA